MLRPEVARVLRGALLDVVANGTRPPRERRLRRAARRKNRDWRSPEEARRSLGERDRFGVREPHRHVRVLRRRPLPRRHHGARGRPRLGELRLHELAARAGAEEPRAGARARIRGRAGRRRDGCAPLDPPLAPDPVAVAQAAHVELAGRRARQRHLEVDRARHLVARRARSRAKASSSAASAGEGA